MKIITLKTRDKIYSKYKEKKQIASKSNENNLSKSITFKGKNDVSKSFCTQIRKKIITQPNLIVQTTKKENTFSIIRNFLETLVNTPKAIYSQILNNKTLSPDVKVECINYIKSAPNRCNDKVSRFIETKKAVNTVINIINNQDIDRRCISSILKSYNEKWILDNYKKLSKYELSPMVRYILARTDCISTNYIEKHKDFSQAMFKLVDETPKNCEILACFLNSYNKNFDITKLTNYVKSVDKANIIELEPAFAEYDTRQIINFLNFHRQRGVQKFTKSQLTFDNNLTQFFKKNPIGFSNQMFDILTAFPSTDKRIGTIPNFWNISEGTNEKIFKATEMFANYFEINRNKTTNLKIKKFLIDQYKKDLQNILKKEVAIEKIGNGSYGEVYKISVKGVKPVVIKLFYADMGRPECGPLIEIPNAVFANNNFPKRFATFYFGKIPHQKDEKGFMVCEFLTPTPEAKLPKIDNTKWTYYYADGNEWNDSRGNIIGGKICDFGCLEIIDKKNKTKNVIFELFEPWSKISK